MRNLSKKQLELLAYIKKYQSDRGEAPTLGEIANKFNISIPAVHLRLRTLVLKGYVAKTPYKPRSFTLKSDLSLKSVSLPLLGVISAGQGISVFEEPHPDLVEVPSSMVNTSYPHYCLKIDGNSMIGDGILSGDNVIIRQQTHANNGDIIVAIIHDEFEEKANLKRYFQRGTEVELRPSNPNLSSKIYRADQIEVRGKYCGLIRQQK